MSYEQFPLLNRKIFITGVSRKRGIGYTIAKECAKQGASIFIQHYEEHDAEQEWGSDDLNKVLEDIKNSLVNGQTFDHIHANFMNDEELDNIKDFLIKNGAIDYLVCNHALSGNDGYLNEISAKSLDMHWQINTKSSILLAKFFVEQHNKSNLGKIIFMTSGQSLGAMPNEISYALSKAGLAEIVKSLAYDLSEKNITVNSVNPGVTNTGYLDQYDNSEYWKEMKQSFPFGRFSEPEDAANIITFLLSDKGSWITGQIINSEGGFRRG